MPTNPIDAYLRGKDDRTKNPNAKSWEDFLPYSYPLLVEAWLDGWYDRKIDLDQICYYCWSRNMTDLPDGIKRCRFYPCRDRNYPPIDKSKVDCHLAKLDAGSYI